MGQFKPMVKMETTEPSVILKLKKGGHVNMKKGGKAESGHKKMAGGGGAMDMMMGTPALVGRPAVNAPVRTPGKPSMASRRKAMMAKPAVTPSGPSMAMPPMKKGGKAEGGKSDMAQDKAMIKKAFKQHDSQEHMGGKGTSLKLKKGGMKKYASGGAIPSETTSGSYKTTLMHQAKADNSPAKTGDVKNGNAGGYKMGGKAKKYATGGVTKSNGGGYKNGGSTGDNIPEETSSGSYDTTKVYSASKTNPPVGTGGVRYGNAGGFKAGGKSSKKAYAAGGTVNSGKPVAMPEGRKPVPSSVKISQLAGTYKSGGRATPAEARLLKNNKAENMTAMREAKTQSNLKYGSPKRMAGGGSTSDKEMDMSNGAYDAHYANERAENEADRNLIPNALKKFGSFVADTFSPSNLSKSFSIQGNFSPEERKQNALTDARIEMAKKIKDVRKSSGMEKKRGGRAC
jgi:hypothetical protein